MKTSTLSALLLGIATCFDVLAAVPADAPAGTMGVCKDGSYSTSAEKKGACRGHKGVKEWYAEGAAPSAKAPATVTTTMTPTSPASPGATTTTKSSTTTVGGPLAPAPQAATRASAGQVWVNTGTKVYHCAGDKWYGKTKAGAYMAESEAQSKGFRAERGKTCS